MIGVANACRQLNATFAGQDNMTEEQANFHQAVPRKSLRYKVRRGDCGSWEMEGIAEQSGMK